MPSTNTHPSPCNDNNPFNMFVTCYCRWLLGDKLVLEEQQLYREGEVAYIQGLRASSGETATQQLMERVGGQQEGAGRVERPRAISLLLGCWAEG